jgi:hypothetical protein
MVEPHNERYQSPIVETALDQHDHEALRRIQSTLDLRSVPETVRYLLGLAVAFELHEDVEALGRHVGWVSGHRRAIHAVLEAFEKRASDNKDTIPSGTGRVVVRAKLDRELFDLVTGYQHQSECPSRAGAVRRLIAVALDSMQVGREVSTLYQQAHNHGLRQAQGVALGRLRRGGVR